MSVTPDQQLRSCNCSWRQDLPLRLPSLDLRSRTPGALNFEATKTLRYSSTPPFLNVNAMNVYCKCWVPYRHLLTPVLILVRFLCSCQHLSLQGQYLITALVESSRLG
jgi:hypothetical protein